MFKLLQKMCNYLHELHLFSGLQFTNSLYEAYYMSHTTSHTKFVKYVAYSCKLKLHSCGSSASYLKELSSSDAFLSSVQVL